MLLPEQEARFIRVDLLEGPSTGYALAELAVKDLAFGASPNAFFQALVREVRGADTPRSLRRATLLDPCRRRRRQVKAVSCRKTARWKSLAAVSQLNVLFVG